MSASDREAFLQRVRQAVQQGNRPGHAATAPERGTVGYQGAGADPVELFRTQLTAAGGCCYVVADQEAAALQVLELVRSRAATKALLGRSSFLDSLGLADRLRSTDVAVTAVDAFSAADCRAPYFAADIAISPVDFLIAETGSVVVRSKVDDPRSVSLLPPIHIAVAERSQLLPDLFDLFAQLKPEEMPSCLTVITGPSKTGDIELRLVTGVHGPGEVHVILLNN
jgi:L-lactate utilization protein LutC